MALGILAGGGWLLAQMLQPPPLQSATRAQVDQQVQQLLIRHRKDGLSATEERQLLERLIALGRYRDSITLVRGRLDQQPRNWRWRLLLSQLLQRAGDRRGADTELDVLLRLHPNRPEILEAKALADLNQGKGQEAIQGVKSRFEGRPKGQRVALGLLLADLQRQTGQVKDASATYLALAQESPTDPRPVLALALIKQEQGQSAQAQELVNMASRRQSPEEAGRRPLTGLAARWALISARSTTGHQPIKDGTSPVPTEASPSHSP